MFLLNNKSKKLFLPKLQKVARGKITNHTPAIRRGGTSNDRAKSLITNPQAGVTLLLAILILASVLAISFSLATIMFIEVRDSGDLLKTEPALYAATGVGEQAFFNLERHICTNGCSYTTSFPNNVAINGPPTVLSTSTPIFVAKVKAGATFGNTLNKYDFCNAAAGASGCYYGKVIVNYITTNSNPTGTLHVYLCQFNPYLTGSSGYTTTPCTVASSTQPYWDDPDGGITDSDGGVSMYSGGNNSSDSWTLTPSWQQQLILTNPGTQGDIYVQIQTYADQLGTIGKGLPYVGQTVVDINTLNAAVGRKIQVIVPNSSSSFVATSSVATQFLVAAPGIATAGSPFSNLLVEATDSNNNVITNYSGTVHFTSTDGTATLPANSTLTNGTGTFSATLNTAGTQTITVTDTATSSIRGTSNSITVNLASKH